MADDKKKAPKKRDPNQPTPKPKKKKSGLIMKALLSGTIGLVSVWMALYSMQIGKAPTSWSNDEWSGFLTFSKQQVEEAKSKVEKVDWEALKGKVTAKTKELWSKTPELEASLEKTLARLRGDTPAKTGERVDSKTGAMKTPAAAIEPSDFVIGCEAMRDATRAYKKVMTAEGSDQAQLKKAKKLFRKAQDHLTRAHAQSQQGDDPGQTAEIEGYLQQCNVYLEDCSKLETL
tara:strand:- start:40 stop:735 length:696 start_codon:yes stop_codon:yes gene_type:complete